ncbi:MAG: HD domain-containing protein [Bacteroidetes bacterium]|nr:HD domain-containing protein [Bacteroidota bacterium]
MKIKILNDPVAGFIRLSDPLLLEIIDHPDFQRLRRIKQLGLTDMVFPGATHSRFQHTLGAFQLLSETLEILKLKDVEISDEEQRSVLISILMHDIGHGPFSHALENTLVEQVDHEHLSLNFMQHFNLIFKGQLDLAIQIFQNKYHRKFFHQLISSQLDMDRLDYLRRDSFYAGVPEGMIGSERLIRMMNVEKDELVIESKGLYSLENFLLARRSMYWQVYLHKTVVAAEMMLVRVLERARELAKSGKEISASQNLDFFLHNELKMDDFNNPKVLDKFADLDDADILHAIKGWCRHPDIVLATLSKGIIDRKLLKIELANKPFSNKQLLDSKENVIRKLKISEKEAGYFVFSDSMQNTLYDMHGEKINVLMSDGKMTDISSASSGFNLSLLIEPIQRFYFCYPKN